MNVGTEDRSKETHMPMCLYECTDADQKGIQRHGIENAF